MRAFLLFVPLLSGPRLAFNRRLNCSRNLRPWRTWGVKKKIQKVETSIWKRNQIYYSVTKIFFASYRGTFHSVSKRRQLVRRFPWKVPRNSKIIIFPKWEPLNREFPEFREKNQIVAATQSRLPFWTGVQLSRDSIRAFNDRIKIRENTVSSLIEWNGNSL